MTEIENNIVEDFISKFFCGRHLSTIKLRTLRWRKLKLLLEMDECPEDEFENIIKERNNLRDSIFKQINDCWTYYLLLRIEKTFGEKNDENKL